MATVTDPSGDPMEGAPVTFTVASGSATVAGGGSKAGKVTATASAVSGLDNKPRMTTFSETVTAH